MKIRTRGLMLPRLRKAAPKRYVSRINPALLSPLRGIVRRLYELDGGPPPTTTPQIHLRETAMGRAAYLGVWRYRTALAKRRPWLNRSVFFFLRIV